MDHSQKLQADQIGSLEQQPKKKADSNWSLSAESLCEESILNEKVL